MEWESCAQVLYIDVGTNQWFKMVIFGTLKSYRSWDISGRYHWVMVGQTQKPSHEEWAESLPLSASVSAARFERLF